jgi:hypothetical protein
MITVESGAGGRTAARNHHLIHCVVLMDGDANRTPGGQNPDADFTARARPAHFARGAISGKYTSGSRSACSRLWYPFG